MKRREKVVWVVVFAAALALLLACASGCATLDRAYRQEVTWTNKPVVQVFTNQVVVTNVVPVVVERTNIVFVTNATSGAVSGYATVEPVATNMVAAVVTNVVPVFMTNLVQVPVTNLVERPEALAAINATGSILNTFMPGVGSIVALALGGLYHGYRQVRNRKVNEALVQGVETAREILTSTPQGQAADGEFVKWLMGHQKEAGVFTTVSALVDQFSDNPAARMTAQEILDRLQRAEQARAGVATAPAVGCPGGGCTMPATAGPGVGCANGQPSRVLLDERRYPSSVHEVVEKLDQEKRMLLTRAESMALDRLVSSLASRVNTQVKLSHVLRSLVTLLLHAEGEIDRKAREKVGLSRPANGDFKALQRFEKEIAKVIAAGLRDAGPIRDA